MNFINPTNEEKTKQMKSIAELRSDYFLRKLFDYLKKKKTLDIIKCNKTLQNRINIDINDYKEYCQLYSSIEIELKPSSHGKFINISDKDKEYFRIYFDNSNEEIKRNYLNEMKMLKLLK